ncbi:MAG: VPLPA-CTERM sorting domain-containing protein [Gammaproteobacteria bacterium]|nr:VPLPA-CTERM sorting domain-containing protein [Gammaproteobacteria bacterium]
MKKTTFLLLALCISTANASVFSGISNGQFVNPTGKPEMVTTGVGTNQFTWGTPTSEIRQSSSLGYTGQSFSSDENEAFVFGTLSYYNGTIKSGTGATTVDLSIILDLDEPSELSKDFAFDLRLINTNNSSDKEASADRVNFDNTVTASYFNIDGVDYTLEFLGFGRLVGGGFTIEDSFSVFEGETASVDLIGRLTSTPTVVPIPAAIWFFGAGLIVLHRMRRPV